LDCCMTWPQPVPRTPVCLCSNRGCLSCFDVCACLSCCLWTQVAGCCAVSLTYLSMLRDYRLALLSLSGNTSVDLWCTCTAVPTFADCLLWYSPEMSGRPSPICPGQWLQHSRALLSPVPALPAACTCCPAGILLKNPANQAHIWTDSTTLVLLSQARCTIMQCIEHLDTV
jgi:hypothetical protein